MEKNLNSGLTRINEKQSIPIPMKRSIINTTENVVFIVIQFWSKIISFLNSLVDWYKVGIKPLFIPIKVGIRQYNLMILS